MRNKFCAGLIACGLSMVATSGMAATSWIWTSNAGTAGNCIDTATAGAPGDAINATTLLSSTSGPTKNTCAGSGTAAVTATVNALSNTNNGGPGGTDTGNGLGSASNANGFALETALSITAYNGGLGVRNRDDCTNGTLQPNCDQYENSGSTTSPATPEHTMDNNQRTDMILLTFDKAISLKQLSVGYWYSDSDVTVLAYQPTLIPGSVAALSTIQSNLIGKTYGSTRLAGATSGTQSGIGLTGWNLIGNYSDVASTGTASNVAFTGGNQGIRTVDINGGNFYSSAWLISARNSITSTGADGTVDYVKLFSVGGCAAGDTSASCKVPEPGSLALLAVGILGAVSIRGRKKRFKA